MEKTQFERLAHRVLSGELAQDGGAVILLMREARKRGRIDVMLNAARACRDPEICARAAYELMGSALEQGSTRARDIFAALQRQLFANFPEGPFPTDEDVPRTERAFVEAIDANPHVGLAPGAQVVDADNVLDQAQAIAMQVVTSFIEENWQDVLDLIEEQGEEWGEYWEWREAAEEIISQEVSRAFEDNADRIVGMIPAVQAHYIGDFGDVAPPLAMLYYFIEDRIFDRIDEVVPDLSDDEIFNAYAHLLHFPARVQNATDAYDLYNVFVVIDDFNTVLERHPDAMEDLPAWGDPPSKMREGEQRVISWDDDGVVVVDSENDFDYIEHADWES